MTKHDIITLICVIILAIVISIVVNVGFALLFVSNVPNDFKIGEAVLVNGNNGVVLENYIGKYVIIRIDNGVGSIPRYSEVRFVRSEVSKIVENKDK